jgi:hypothetical protein
MPDADGENPSEKIQVFVSVGVPDKLVLGSLDDQRLLKVMEYRGEEILATGENDSSFVTPKLYPSIQMDKADSWYSRLNQSA